MAIMEGGIKPRDERVRPWKILTYYKSQKDLEETLSKAAEKQDGTKWAFRTFRSVDSDKRQGRHGWSLDKLSNEVIHPLVKPEKLVEIVDNLRRDNQPRDPKNKDKDKKEQCIECLALKYVVTEKDVVDFINEYSDI
ncbi:unnamed protein product [Rhizophagus irregularis]|nr:unnamed protein product [Rhizophagus irregularis]